MPKPKRYAPSSAQLSLFPIDAAEAGFLPDAEPVPEELAAAAAASVNPSDQQPAPEPANEVASGSRRPRSEMPPLRIVVPQKALTITRGRDFRIAETHGVGAGSLKQKLAANLTAIRTLKQIEGEGREATAEEKGLLVRYSGWGALPQVFERYPRPDWKQGAEDLRSLLDSEELASARASTPNAHYTSVEIIRFMWDALRQMGVGPGIRVLEPACGIGHFFGCMPEALLPGSQRTGVELDSLSARIAQMLYPDVAVFESAFEKSSLPDGFYDVAIGNVPFGNVQVFDPAYRRQSAFTRSLHDYFLVKSLDKVRRGGVLALITSMYTLDKRDAAVRRHLSQQADLVAAYRLPNTAFLHNAGTKVTTDLLFLRKR